ncbi:MAG TPA: DUF1905 domain-containing protein [Kofleriaceae bacterium]|jgi:hypothetical protein|nr:DUF1905 domain-containing protein [Kofleriaceae bacterium]
MLALQFTGRIWYWRGPAPWYFVSVPRKHSAAIRALATVLTYGWGVIPVTARIGNTEWTTSLFPREELYAVPVRADVRKAERLDEGSRVRMKLITGDPR